MTPLIVAPRIGGQLLGKGVDVENYPGVSGQMATGPGVIELMRDQALTFQTRMLNDAVVAADLSTRPFKLTLNGTTSDGREFVPYSITTEALILATGAESRWLGVPGELEFRGGGVTSCATCDGYLYRDQAVVVIGGGDTAMEDALVLARTSSSVTIVHRRGSFRASRILQERVLQHDKITVLWNRVVSAFEGEASLTHVVTQASGAGSKTERIAARAAFIAIGHEPATGMFKGQLEMDQHGYVKVDSPSTCTSVAGVFAAGDVSDKTYRQAITSAGTGATAALDAERWMSSGKPATKPDDVHV